MNSFLRELLGCEPEIRGVAFGSMSVLRGWKEISEASRGNE